MAKPLLPPFTAAVDPAPPVARAERVALSAEDLAEMFGVSVRTIWALDAAGKLPSPIFISERCPRWLLSEILEWLAAAAAPERCGKPPTRQEWNDRKRSASSAKRAS